MFLLTLIKLTSIGEIQEQTVQLIQNYRQWCRPDVKNVNFKYPHNRQNGKQFILERNLKLSLVFSSFLFILAKIEFTLQPIDTTVGIGQRVEFLCRARGGKSPDLFWEYQNRRYSRGMSTSEPVRVTNENTLVISKTNLVSGGTILCRVEDLDKEINAKATLTVLGMDN